MGIENKHQSNMNPDARRKCPECGSTTFSTCASYGKIREVINGKTIYNKFSKEDAGSFTCGKCEYYETY